ncbi:MAG: hypothetical protein JWN99_2510 [Ilumatobacteraceae bacterium]|nr:hypothetical protein [Ilumatobacteraceae bacterium]
MDTQTATDRLLAMCRTALDKKDALAADDTLGRAYLAGLIDGYLAASDLYRGDID